MSNHQRVNFLLKKYSHNKSVPGESRSRETMRRMKQEKRVRDRHIKARIIIDEMRLNKYQKERVKYMINTFTNFKKLHRTVSEECIICAFCFYVKKIDYPKIQIEDYKACKKYKLSNAVFEMITCRLLNMFMQKDKLPCDVTTRVDHNILLKQSY